MEGLLAIFQGEPLLSGAIAVSRHKKAGGRAGCEEGSGEQKGWAPAREVSTPASSFHLPQHPPAHSLLRHLGSCGFIWFWQFLPHTKLLL